MRRVRTIGARIRPWLPVLAAELALFVVYYLVVVGGVPLSGVLAWLVVFVAVPTSWLSVFGLWRLLRVHRENRVLRDRFFVATMLATVVTVFGAVFVNNDIIPPPFTVDQTRIVTRLAILSLTLPALYWLMLYRRAR